MSHDRNNLLASRRNTLDTALATLASDHPLHAPLQHMQDQGSTDTLTLQQWQTVYQYSRVRSLRDKLPQAANAFIIQHGEQIILANHPDLDALKEAAALAMKEASHQVATYNIPEALAGVINSALPTPNAANIARTSKAYAESAQKTRLSFTKNLEASRTNAAASNTTFPNSR